MSMNDPKRHQQKCYRCGKTSHKANDCWFKDKNCRKCDRPGHIERMCRQKSSRKQPPEKDKKTKFRDKRIHNVTENGSESTSESDTNGLGCLKLHNVNESEDRKTIWVTPDVSGVSLKMELDHMHCVQR